MRKLAVVGFLVSTIVAACSSDPTASLYERVDASNTYPSVGMIAYENIQRCTGTVLKDGVIVTAKHCFQRHEVEGRNLSKISVNFPSQDESPPLFIKKIKSVIFDTDLSDIAYIIFDPTVSVDLVPDFRVVRDLPAENQLTQLVGFPVQESLDKGFPKVIAQDCMFTGNTGAISPTEMDSGYDGLLYETSCEGWWGISGGPVLRMADDGDEFDAIIGVVTHTFHLDDDGNIDEDKIEEDMFGKYVKDVVISPFAQAEKLDDVLNLDPQSVPDPMISSDPSVICGYNNASELVQVASDAIDFLAQGGAFQSTFWVEEGDADTVAFFDQMMRDTNDSYKASRQSHIRQFDWAGDVYSDYDAILALESLEPLRNLDIGHLGLSASYEDCDTLACTNYGGFVVHANSNEVSKVFSKNSNDFARKTMKGVLGHELGHYILDYYLLKAKGFASLAEAQASEGVLKYHLTVDAIGMVLNGYSAEDFSTILKTSLSSEIFGDLRMVADSEDRAFCLDNL